MRLLLVAHVKARWVTTKEAWPAVRQRIAIWMLRLFKWGSAAMWSGSIFSLIVFGGFPGITCWQGMGIWYLYFINHTTTKRLEAKNLAGEYEVTGVMRERLEKARRIVEGKKIANLVCIFLIIINLSLGRLKWTNWDTRAFIFAGVVVSLVFIIGWVLEVKVLQNAWAVFVLVFATRIVPQSFLGLSDSLALINWLILGGLLAIAFQRLVISLIELAEAIAARLSRENQVRAWLLGLGDTLNFGSALIPSIFKMARF